MKGVDFFNNKKHITYLIKGQNWEFFKLILIFNFQHFITSQSKPVKMIFVVLKLVKLVYFCNSF